MTTFESSLGEGLVLLGCGVTDGLIDGKNSACGLTCSSEYVQAHDLGLPNELFKHIGNFTF